MIERLLQIAWRGASTILTVSTPASAPGAGVIHLETRVISRNGRCAYEIFKPQAIESGSVILDTGAAAHLFL